RIVHRSQRYPVDLASVVHPGRALTTALGHFDSEPSLTGTSDSTNRDEPPRKQQRQHRGDFSISTDESRQVRREGVAEELLVNGHDRAPLASPFAGTEKLGKYADVEARPAHPARAYPAPCYSDSPKTPRESAGELHISLNESCHSPALSSGFRTVLVRSLRIHRRLCNF